jgi:hypothetical protein
VFKVENLTLLQRTGYGAAIASLGLVAACSSPKPAAPQHDLSCSLSEQAAGGANAALMSNTVQRLANLFHTNSPNINNGVLLGVDCQANVSDTTQKDNAFITVPVGGQETSPFSQCVALDESDIKPNENNPTPGVASETFAYCLEGPHLSLPSGDGTA